MVGQSRTDALLAALAAELEARRAGEGESMAALTDAHLTITVDSSAFEAALEKTHAAVVAVLRLKYLADGCPNGETPEGFEAWMAAGEAQITATFEQVDKPLPTPEEWPRFLAHLECLRKRPPGSADDCEVCP